MTGSGLWVVQKAIYAALTADATLMALISGVFDEVPAPAVFPYVTLGDVTEAPFRTFGNGGHDQTVTLHVWSQKTGFKEAEDIVSRITVLLETQPFVIESHNTVLVNHELSTTLRDEDGITRHIAARYRVIIQD